MSEGRVFDRIFAATVTTVIGFTIVISIAVDHAHASRGADMGFAADDD